MAVRVSFLVSNAVPNSFSRHCVASGLFDLYGGYSASLVATVEYPEHSWEAWKFIRSPFTWFAQFRTFLMTEDPVALAALRLFTSALAQKYNTKTFDMETYKLLNDTDRARVNYLGGIEALLSKLNQSTTTTGTHRTSSVVLGRLTVLKSWESESII